MDETAALIPWASGTWTNPPVAVRSEGDNLLVTAVEGSDAWRHTSYGFVHSTEHGLLGTFGQGSALEVDFTADLSEQFDQAGILIRADAENWIKAGVEFADGQPQVGAVVTRGHSDWSVAPVPEWLGTRVTIRASWADDAITLRARAGLGDWRLVRLIPWELPSTAGPMICAPTRAGLEVRFHVWRVVEPDDTLH